MAAELWGSVVASLLFWGFANEVTTVEEAKKYYPLFGLGANVALIFSGQYVKWVSNLRRTLAPGVDAWAMSLRYLMGAVLVSGGVLLAAYKHIQDKVVAQDPAMQQMKKFPTKKRAKMSMKESAQFLLGSKYIRDLAVLVISYGMCINIVEVSWKAKLKMAFPDPNSYSAFSAYKTYSIPCPSSQVNFDSRWYSFVSHLPVAFLFSLSLSRTLTVGNFSSATGAVTLIMMLLGRTIFAKFGWRIAALVTPMVCSTVLNCNYRFHSGNFPPNNLLSLSLFR